MTQKTQKPPIKNSRILDCAMHRVDPQIDAYKQARSGMEQMRNDVHDRIGKSDINRVNMISIQLYPHDVSQYCLLLSRCTQTR